MNSLDLIKLSDYTPENINSLSNVEKLILFYFKGESDQVKSLIGELNQEDVCYAIDKFYSSETVKVFDLLKIQSWSDQRNGVGLFKKQCRTKVGQGSIQY
jgi:hypothetical protein